MKTLLFIASLFTAGAEKPTSTTTSCTPDTDADYARGGEKQVHGPLRRLLRMGRS
jgi:hypothetical protein